MLTYLIIMLDDTATSYCHYAANTKERRLISLNDLKAGILFAMKENLNVQFVYPDYELPQEYKDAIETVDHVNIKPLGQNTDVDVTVLEGWDGADEPLLEGKNCIIRTSCTLLAQNKELLKGLLTKASRVNVVLTDVDAFTDEDIESYRDLLAELAHHLVNLFKQGNNPQLNLLTDRMLLTRMNNCNAGDTNVTLAPNGKFYLCPAFYYEDAHNDVGSLTDGLDVKNPQLLRLNHAPICRMCDAFQCKRCIWMNGRLTLDYNTPSHQQCVVAHLERNATRSMMLELEKEGLRIDNAQPIKELTELDPFNIVNKWK